MFTKKTWYLIPLIFISSQVLALTEPIDIDRLVEAVGKAEGGIKASVPYGLIYSKWCMEEKGWCKYYAREVLMIHVNRCFGDDEFMATSSLIECVGSYYSPPAAHHLNTSWASNTLYWYNKGE